MHNQHRIYRVLQLIAILQKEPAKSIRNLSVLIKTTERTVYRYLDLIKDLGFDVQKDDFNKYSLKHTQNLNELNFTLQETNLIGQMLQTVAKHNKLKDSILKKINFNNENAILSNMILKANLGKIIDTITTAITANKQVVLVKYQSANSKTISNRIIEPIQFTDNYASLVAYEIETDKNKFFNIDRITEVKILSKTIKHKEKHLFDVPDAFGFGYNNIKYNVILKLNLRAYVILKEDYPLVIPYIKTVSKKNNIYILNINVNNFKPITRFVIGLINDVEVIGSEEFKQHLKTMANTILSKTNLKKESDPLRPL